MRAASLGRALGLACPLLLAPVLWFPWRWPVLTVVALVALALAAGVICLDARKTVRSGLEAPLLYVLLATSVATIPIVNWRLGMPKVLGIAAGAVTLLGMRSHVVSRRRLNWAVTGLACLTLALAGVGLVGTEGQLGRAGDAGWPEGVMGSGAVHAARLRLHGNWARSVQPGVARALRAVFGGAG